MLGLQRQGCANINLVTPTHQVPAILEALGHAIDERGVARRGVLLRHLVMPGGVATSREVFRFVRDELSPRTYVNVMAQWHPAGESGRFPEIDRRITGREYDEAREAAVESGLERLDERRPRPRSR